MEKLRNLADVVRSKNSGPFEITFDVIFAKPDVYERVKASGVLNAALICNLYTVTPADIRALMFFDPAQAFKFTLQRKWAQGGIGERDTFGAQQHAPLLDIEIPNKKEETQ